MCRSLTGLILMVGRWERVWLTSVPWTWYLNLCKPLYDPVKRPVSTWLSLHLAALLQLPCELAGEWMTSLWQLASLRWSGSNVAQDRLRSGHIWCRCDQIASLWNTVDLLLPQELAPVMKELGIPSTAEMGYDKPELALPNPYNIH